MAGLAFPAFGAGFAVARGRRTFRGIRDRVPLAVGALLPVLACLRASRYLRIFDFATFL